MLVPLWDEEGEEMILWFQRGLRGDLGGEMGETLKEAKRRLEEMEMKAVQKPAPLRVKGRMNTPLYPSFQELRLAHYPQQVEE